MVMSRAFILVLLSATPATFLANSKRTTVRILVKFFPLSHILHPLLKYSDSACPVLSLLLALAEEIQALPGPFEDHRQTPVLRYWANQLPQNLWLATLLNALYLHDGDWICVRQQEKKDEEERTNGLYIFLTSVMFPPNYFFVLEVYCF